MSFKPEISATYGLAIMLQGIQLQGSPFKIRVRNDETIAGNCRLYGSSLAIGTAGEALRFCIQGSPADTTVMLLLGAGVQHQDSSGRVRQKLLKHISHCRHGLIMAV